jgi:hypothetical protein
MAKSNKLAKAASSGSPGVLVRDTNGNLTAAVSGTDLKTVNGNSVLGSGDIDFQTIDFREPTGTGDLQTGFHLINIALGVI